MSPLINENELIAKVLIGNDQHAFGLLVKHYQQSVRQYCRRLCFPDVALADDIAQETFLQAFRKLNLYQSKGKFISWLLRIAYFQFLQHLRKTKLTCELDEELDGINDANIAESIGRARDLDAAIAQLTVHERNCITLQYSFGYTQEQISEMIEMPLGTVKSHIKRGKNKLARLLAKHEPTQTLTGAA